jgi:hypothetical protein
MSTDLEKRIEDLEVDILYLEGKIDRLRDRLNGRIDELAQGIREDAEVTEEIRRRQMRFTW